MLLRPVELAQVFKDTIAHKLLVDKKRLMHKLYTFLLSSFTLSSYIIIAVLGLPEVGTFSSLFPELKVS